MIFENKMSHGVREGAWGSGRPELSQKSVTSYCKPIKLTYSNFC